MAYSKIPIGTLNPGCIVILVDQSWSMSEPFGDGTKAEQATQAVNCVIQEIAFACRTGDTIQDRCHVSVIGYGDSVDCVVSGMISEVFSASINVEKVKKSIRDGAGGVVEVNAEIPIWLEPKANSGTPMHEAFEHAAKILENWISDNPKSFPPMVINIAGSPASHPDLTADAAKKIMNFHTTDGDVLVFNCQIANSENTAFLPHNTTQFTGDSLAEFLFEISSALPQEFFKPAEGAGFSPEQGARCFGYNVGPDLVIRLLEFGYLFGALGITQVSTLPLLPEFGENMEAVAAPSEALKIDPRLLSEYDENIEAIATPNPEYGENIEATATLNPEPDENVEAIAAPNQTLKIDPHYQPAEQLSSTIKPPPSPPSPDSNPGSWRSADFWRNPVKKLTNYWQYIAMGILAIGLIICSIVLLTQGNSNNEISTQDTKLRNQIIELNTLIQALKTNNELLSSKIETLQEELDNKTTSDVDIFGLVIDYE